MRGPVMGLGAGAGLAHVAGALREPGSPDGPDVSRIEPTPANDGPENRGFGGGRIALDACAAREPVPPNDSFPNAPAA
jgi:hypothetical protein